MPIKKILKLRKRVGRQVKREIEELEKKMIRRRTLELKTEIIVAFVFTILSGLYVVKNYGFGKLEDVLFFWMFPASIMIFLTLIAVFIVEHMKGHVH